MSNEFFDRELGRMGGFGWAARTSAECLAEARLLGYRPLFLPGRGGLGDRRPARHASGIPLVRYDEDAVRYGRTLDRARLSLFLTIDHRPNYLPVLESRVDAPVVVWVRDPRTPQDLERIATLEIPSSATRPFGVQAIDCRSLGTFVERAEARGTAVVLASPAPTLATPRMAATYGTDTARLEFLPNPVPVVTADVRRADRPRIAFLGRLDPIKRPWVFVELARRFPRAEFVMLGQPHFSGTGSWLPDNAPANLRLLGHVGGDTKRQLLGSAWMIVNTSIHESLPISFLEALHCGTPIVGCQDPEHVTSRFGVFVGEWRGSGLEGLTAFSGAVERLLDDEGLRLRLGHEGRDWARSTHTSEHFLAAFSRVADSIDGGDGR